MIDLMPVVQVNTISDFADKLNSVYKSRCKNSDMLIVSVVAYYEYIVSLAEELVKRNYMLKEIDLSSINNSGYDREYLLSIFDDSITVEPLWNVKNQRYIDDISDVCYVHQDCHSSVLSHIKGNICYEFCVLSYDDCEHLCNNECVDEFDCEHGNHGFTMSYNNSDKNWSISFYSDVDRYVKDMIDYCKTII